MVVVVVGRRRSGARLRWMCRCHGELGWHARRFVYGRWCHDGRVLSHDDRLIVLGRGATFADALFRRACLRLAAVNADLAAWVAGVDDSASSVGSGVRLRLPMTSCTGDCDSCSKGSFFIPITRETDLSRLPWLLASVSLLFLLYSQISRCGYLGDDVWCSNS